MSSLLTRIKDAKIVAALAALVVVAAAVLTWQLAASSQKAGVLPVSKADGSYIPGTVPTGEAALAVAVKALPAALTYDYRTLGKNLSAATALMTPAFAKQFSSVYNRTVGQLATKRDAITRAVVRGGGILSASSSSVSTLVFIDQLLVDATNSSSAPVTVSESRVVVTLVPVDGKWKVEAIDPF